MTRRKQVTRSPTAPKTVGKKVKDGAEKVKTTVTRKSDEPPSKD